MTALTTLARMLGISPRLAEDAMHSERAAKVALSRRNLFLSAGAMAAGMVVGLPAAPDVENEIRVWLDGVRLPLTYFSKTSSRDVDVRSGYFGPWFHDIELTMSQSPTESILLRNPMRLRVSQGHRVYEADAKVQHFTFIQSFTRTETQARLFCFDMREVAA